jgi:hypothetical protein
MINEPQFELPPPLWFLRARVEKILPRATREQCMEDLDSQYKSSLAIWLWQLAATIAYAYKTQAVAAFDKLAFALLMVGAAYCFLAAGFSWPSLIVVLLILFALILRDAYTHPREGSFEDPIAEGETEADVRREPKPARSELQYGQDCGLDAAIVAVLALGAEAFMVVLLPTLAPSKIPFVRSILVAIPVLGTLRMTFRPRLDVKMPFDGSQIPAEVIFKRTWMLNVMWMLACMGTIIANPDSLPDFVPNHDFFRTFIPGQMFVYWVRLQQNGLIYRDYIETLFGDWREKKKLRHSELLIKGLTKQEPLYPAYIVLQVLLLLYLTIPLATALWPWLAGRETDVDMWRIFIDLATLVALLCSWNYLKNCNRVAADALKAEAKAFRNALAYPVWT